MLNSLLSCSLFSRNKQSTSTLITGQEFAQSLEAFQHKRRDKALALLKAGCVNGHLTSCAALGHDIARNQLRTLSILQGPTTTDETLITLYSSKRELFHFYLFEKATSQLLPTSRLSVERNNDSRFNDSTFLILTLEREFKEEDKEYRLLILDESNKLIDVRDFSLMNRRPGRFSFGVASCMSAYFPKIQKMMWENVRLGKPEALFLIGDNVYADVVNGKVLKGGADPTLLWNQYIYARKTLDLYSWQKLIPTFSMWDDHDYGINDGGKDFRYKKESGIILRTFFPLLEKSSAAFRKGPGASFRYSYRGQHFFFFDNRSFRDSNRDDNGQHFGEEQESWMLAQVYRLKGPKWMIAGDQFFGQYHHYESFEGQHLRTFGRFLSKLRKAPGPYIFLSGDRHMGELMKIKPKHVGHLTYEITTSPIHSLIYPHTMQEDPNPRALARFDDHENFALIDSLAILSDRPSLEVSVRMISKENEVILKKDLQVSYDYIKPVGRKK